MKLKAKQWQVVLVNRDLVKLKKHMKEEMKATIEEMKVFKVSGKEGTVGRYFLTSQDV